MMYTLHHIPTGTFYCYQFHPLSEGEEPLMVFGDLTSSATFPFVKQPSNDFSDVLSIIAKSNTIAVIKLLLNRSTEKRKEVEFTEYKNITMSEFMVVKAL